MSYYGIRKPKIEYNEEHKWHLTCEYYDSSIWTWDYKRAWEKRSVFYCGYETREELEKVIFTDTYNGNIRGMGGKFGSASFVSGYKFTLDDNDKKVLDEIQEQMENLRKQIKHLRNETEYGDKEKAECKQLCEQENTMRMHYNKLRLDFSYKAWLKYESTKSKRKVRYIVRLNFKHSTRGLYTNIFVSNIGVTNTHFVYSLYDSKPFNMPLDKLIEHFANNDSYSNIRIYEVNEKDLKSRGKRRTKYCDNITDEMLVYSSESKEVK